MEAGIKTKASQKVVPIKEIRDDVVVLKDGSLRMILMTSALNFALKSSEEQSAIILQYQNFLNSLDFSMQVFIQSRDLNIDPYIKTLKERAKEQTNELLKIQMREYIDFVKEFVSATSIVNKTFYIVVPYTPSLTETAKKNPIFEMVDKFIGGDKKQAKPTDKDSLEEYKIQLQQRADTIIQGLSRIGVRAVPLNTEELIELYFKLFNPSELETSKIPKHGAAG
jgi:hypothetical protein